MGKRAEDSDDFEPRGYRSEEKIPRWALMLAVFALFAVCGVFMKNIYADSVEAKKLADRHETLIPLMQSDIKEIKESNRDMNRKIDQILLAVKS